MNYITKLTALNETAGRLMREYVIHNGFGDSAAIIDYAYSLVTKYGEGSAALSAEMYDAIAQMQRKIILPAEVAPTATYKEVAKAVNGTIKKSVNPSSIASTVNRLVKKAGTDTTLINAARDGAEYAWVPMGDTCAFCITLASRGWLPISRDKLKNHRDHLHSNCDCTYAVRFDGKSGIAGYDPDKYLEIYQNADGSSSTDKINSIRRMQYAARKDIINAQKRSAYALRKALQDTENEYKINRMNDENIQNLIIAAQGADDARIPESMIGDFSDYSSLDLGKEDIEILQTLHQNSIDTGYEYGKILYDGGETEILTSNLHNKVKLPVAEIDGDNLRVYHSHTNDTPPSWRDFIPLIDNKVSQIGVISRNGDIWIVKVGDGIRPSVDDYLIRVDDIREEVNSDVTEFPNANEWTIEELNYMAIRETFYRISREFGWIASGGSINE